MGGPAVTPEVVAASADDVLAAQSDAVSAAAADIVEADTDGPDAGLRTGRASHNLQTLPPGQAADQAMATVTAEPHPSEAHDTPHAPDDPAEDADAATAQEADATEANPYLVHDDPASDAAPHDDGVIQDDAAAHEVSE